MWGSSDHFKVLYKGDQVEEKEQTQTQQVLYKLLVFINV